MPGGFRISICRVMLSGIGEQKENDERLCQFKWEEALKPKILFYISTLRKGGAERVMLQLVRHFYLSGYTVLLITTYPASDDEYTVPSEIRRISMAGNRGKNHKLVSNLLWIARLRGICAREKPSVIISFMREPNIRSIIAAVGLPVKTITSVRNDPNEAYSGFLGRFAGRFMLPFSDGCVFQTEEAKAWFPQTLQRKSKVILNAVSKEFFEVKRNGTKTVVSIGRLEAQKNHALLVSVFERILKHYPAYKLFIYGEGRLRGELEKYISEHKLQGKVILMGATSDVPDVLSRAGVFVLSSDYEGMPNALMEAMAAGVPCIAADCPSGGPRRLISNRENGLLFSPGSQDELYRAMNELLSDPLLSRRLGHCAKEFASRNYSPDSVYGEWVSYVNQIIEER